MSDKHDPVQRLRLDAQAARVHASTAPADADREWLLGFAARLDADAAALEADRGAICLQCRIRPTYNGVDYCGDCADDMAP